MDGRMSVGGKRGRGKVNELVRNNGWVGEKVGGKVGGSASW